MSKTPRRVPSGAGLATTKAHPRAYAEPSARRGGERGGLARGSVLAAPRCRVGRGGRRERQGNQQVDSPARGVPSCSLLWCRGHKGSRSALSKRPKRLRRMRVGDGDCSQKEIEPARISRRPWEARSTRSGRRHSGSSGGGCSSGGQRRRRVHADDDRGWGRVWGDGCCSRDRRRRGGCGRGGYREADTTCHCCTKVGKLYLVWYVCLRCTRFLLVDLSTSAVCSLLFYLKKLFLICIQSMVHVVAGLRRTWCDVQNNILLLHPTQLTRCARHFVLACFC